MGAKMKLKAESFDILGLFTFSFITILSVWSLLSGELFPKWAVFLLLIIGVLGLIIDGAIVYQAYIKKAD